MINKRGLSKVVTVRLLLLLSIAAVVIVWSFVRPAITDVGQKISSECLTVSLDAVSCNADSIAETLAVVVKNGAGQTNIAGVNLILYDDDGGSEVGQGTNCANIGPLAQDVCDIPASITDIQSTLDKVGVAPILANNEVCAESSVIGCTVV